MAYAVEEKATKMFQNIGEGTNTVWGGSKVYCFFFCDIGVHFSCLLLHEYANSGRK